VYTKHAEFKAGIVVLSALVVFLGFLFWAGGADSIWARYRHVTMRLQSGSTAPKVGDPVLLNGFPVGRVERVEPAVEERSGTEGPRRLKPADYAALRLDPSLPPPPDAKVREIYIRCVCRLDEARELPVGTTAEISKSLTGTRELQLKPGFSTRNLSDADTETDPIPVVAAGDFGDLQRAVQGLADKIGLLVDKGGIVVDKVGATLDDVRGLVASVRAKVDAIDAKGIQDNVLAASASLREALGTIEKRVDEIGGRLASAAQNVDRLTGRGQEVVDAAGKDLTALLSDLRKLVADMDAVVGDIRPKVNTILDNVTEASASVAKLGKDLEGLGPRLEAIVGTTGTGLERVLARLAEVGHNLSDVSEDLRAHPWKLLNKPEDKEIAFENLRNAASNFVRASGVVEGTVKDLKALEARRDLVPAEQARLVRETLARLEADLAKYGEAEAHFSRLLRGGASSMPGR
jgi:ABC-type transporter Mla subunit MlaD